MENKEERPAKQEVDMLERMIRDQSANGRKNKDIPIGKTKVFRNGRLDTRHSNPLEKEAEQ